MSSKSTSITSYNYEDIHIIFIKIMRIKRPIITSTHPTAYALIWWFIGIYGYKTKKWSKK